MENYIFKSQSEIEREEMLKGLGYGAFIDEIDELDKSIKRRIVGAFIVEDLYWDWDYRTIGERIKIGIRFKDYVRKGIFKDVVIHIDGVNSTNVYMKTSSYNWYNNYVKMP